MSQSGGQDAAGGANDPFADVEEFSVTGSRSNYDQLAKGAEVFTVFPDSFSNFMAAQGRMDAITAAMVASMNSRPGSQLNSTGPQPDVQTLARSNAALMSNLAPTSTTMALSGGAFLGIGAFAIGAGLAAVLSGGLATIPLGFYGATVTGASAGGAFALGGGFMMIGGANLAAAGSLRRAGK